MKRYRFSIASLMAVILMLAVGMAALRTPSELWASATFTAAVILFLTSIVGAMVDRAQTRQTWVGMAVFGWGYFVIAFAPLGAFATDPPRLLPASLLEYVMDDVVSDGKLPYWSQSIRVRILYTTAIRGGSAVPAGGMKHVNVTAYRQTGHSLGAILFGIMGAMVGRFLAARGERSESG